LLGYLDALIAALSVRDATEAERLMAHPLARLLPEDVRAEAAAFAAGERDPLAAPLRAMQLRYQTAELLRDSSPLADQPETVVEPRLPAIAPPSMGRRARHQQMELPLSA
jgi:hypothetical protein